MLTSIKALSRAASAPGDRTGGSFINNETEDERRLTAELEAVLGRSASNPRRSDMPTGPEAQDARRSTGDFESGVHGGLNEHRSFQWRSADGAALHVSPDGTETHETDDETELRQGVVPPSALKWLAKARRQKRWSRVKSAGAWIATLLIGGAIIAVTAWLLLGQKPFMAALADISLVRLP